MEFVDRLLTCADCGGEFIFTAGEQLFSSTSSLRTTQSGASPVSRSALPPPAVLAADCCSRPIADRDSDRMLGMWRRNHCSLQAHPGSPCPLPSVLPGQASLGRRIRFHSGLGCLLLRDSAEFHRRRQRGDELCQPGARRRSEPGATSITQPEFPSVETPRLLLRGSGPAPALVGASCLSPVIL